ncbi:hypothetical protein [Vreelandella venusta]|uniref:hypothetical protein n=1 Tax=Vreelandella venusta TaxID=44935 RepID=UPI00116FBB3A|nr:hypothetical protein [Halomonas venusta]GEK52382.1 hypothetical protein HVE01_31030 [Halomonas venusta]
MERWVRSLKRKATVPEIDLFIEDIKKVYQKHGLALSHEDAHGAFQIVLLDPEHIIWLEDALDDRDYPQKER